MLEFIKVLLIGIIEGITEWLPISSTGHMILAEEFLKLDVTKEFWDMFLVVIQLGAILAVVFLYFEKLNPFSPKKSKKEKGRTWQIWFKVFVACLPAAVIGLLLDDWLNKHFYNYVVVAITLIIYGIAFIAIENKNVNHVPQIQDFSKLSYKTALAIGLFQVLALIPGTSRSGATIIGGLLLGTSRHIAAEFSFFLSIPVMLGASILKLSHFGSFGSWYEFSIVIFGMVVAFIVSILAIKFLIGFIQNNNFKVFGYYRIILGIIVLGYFFFIAP